MHINDLLKVASERKASDLHLKVGSHPVLRIAGYYIGSGAVESAVSHVMQQRMKRVGMRWHAAGADAMLALRCVFRSTGAWDSFWNYRKQVA